MAMKVVPLAFKGHSAMQQTVDSDINTHVPYLVTVAESTAPSAQHFVVLVCRCVHRPFLELFGNIDIYNT